jgi:hypothetical protein
MRNHDFFRTLAELSPGLPKYVGDKELIVDLEAVFGYGEYQVDDLVLVIKIRNAYLQLFNIPGRVQNGTRYEVRLQKFDMERTEHAHKEKNKRTSGSVSGKIEAKIETWLPSFVGRLRSDAHFDAQGHTRTGTESIIRPEVMLISPTANHRWLIGHHDLGDPRKPGGFLHGSYFQEARHVGQNEYEPLCRLALGQYNQSFELGMGIIVKYADFHFSVTDKWGVHVREAGVNQKQDFERRMKAKLAGIALQKALKEAIERQDGSFNPNNEILLFLSTINNFDTERVS